MVEVEKIAEKIQERMVHPLGMMNVKMIDEFGKIIQELNDFKERIEQFKERWKIL